MNRLAVAVVGAAALWGGAHALARRRRVRPTCASTIRMIDGGASETAAFADLNNDRRLDIVSGDAWYEAPAWTKHTIRDINWNGQYVDNFTDLPIDVDGDGFVDVVQFGYFANNIVWMKNPGKAGGAWTVTEIDKGFPTEFALLVDLDNDGQARELLPQFDRAGGAARLVRSGRRRVDQARRQRSQLRPRHRRGRRERRRPQRHPHAAAAGSRRRPTCSRHVDVPRRTGISIRSPRADGSAGTGALRRPRRARPAQPRAGRAVRLHVRASTSTATAATTS